MITIKENINMSRNFKIGDKVTYFDKDMFFRANRPVGTIIEMGSYSGRITGRVIGDDKIYYSDWYYLDGFITVDK